jgi:hypothetical protein
MSQRWSATVCTLLGALALAGCPTEQRTDDLGGGRAVDADPVSGDHDAGAVGGGGAIATSSKGGSSAGGSSGGGSQAAGGGMPAPDAGTSPPPPNHACTVAAQCASGFCVDGVCCDAACDGACQSCAQTGKVGSCAPVRNATDDACTGGATCDSAGACKKDLGQTCAASNQCASGSCVDGVCCATSACAACQACAVPGVEGKCAPVARFVDDDTCSGSNTCNGLGDCHGKNGIACTAAKDCVSGNCVDGVCCDAPCDGICFSCNQGPSPGTCRPIDGAPDPSASTPCDGANICAVQAGGQPACKLKSGQTCATNAQCASATCQTIVVPPDPNDPYDLGYSYARCE